MIWPAAFLVMFGLIGGLTGGWTGAIGLMAMFLAFRALGERITTVMAPMPVFCLPARSHSHVIAK